MANPPDSFPSDLDPYRLLAQMYGGGLFGASRSPNWSDYVRAQYMPDPSRVAASASDTPGFHKSPAVLEALAAADPRPAGFYRSPSLLGSGTPTPTDLPPAMDPQTALFRWLGLPPSWPPSGPKVASAMMPTPYGQQTSDTAVSNFNVGVIAQKAGLPLILVLWLAGKYAAEKSNNYKPINRSASIHVQGNGSKRDIVPVHVAHSIHRANRENKTRRRIRSIAGQHLRRQTLPQRMAITEDAAANKRPSS